MSRRALTAQTSAMIVLALAALSVAVTSLVAQTPPAISHPSFAGTWAPSMPEASDRRFEVGLTMIPGQGRLTIEQRANRLTVTMTVPDDKLDQLIVIRGRFYPTAIYYLIDAQSRPGGYGAGGPPRPTQPTWFDDRLVVPDPWPGLTHPTIQTYSLDGDSLKLETRVEVSAGRENIVTELFAKVK